jgi:phosphatidylserine/phosphatidylglycerophosphate/cardiolipin synthase-like enzyme
MASACKKKTMSLLRTLSRLLLVSVLMWLAVVSFRHTTKPLPPGLNYLSREYAVAAADVAFLADLTFLDASGERKHEQEIFDAMFKAIDEAERYILLDMFLFNDYGAKASETHRQLSSELTDRLVARKKEKPNLHIDFITDPINTIYGGANSRHLTTLREAGINVIVADLVPLRDSNFLYSALWRTFFEKAGNNVGGRIKHPFSASEPKVSLRSYLTMLNFKANHRKVFVADSGSSAVSIVTSANPHDGSSAHSNIAIMAKGPLAEAIYETEAGVAAMSGAGLGELPAIAEASDFDAAATTTAAKVQIASEGKIKELLLKELTATGETGRIKVTQFYLADRQVVRALLAAAERGAEIELVLDPNKDAFGYQKNGIPNRQAASELVSKGQGRIKIRWYDTHGEQFHAKMFVRADGERVRVLAGSANLTRRNLDNYNLELNILADLPADSASAKAIDAYFKRIWNNEGGAYTVDYDSYQDDSRPKRILYLLQERLGLGSF